MKQNFCRHGMSNRKPYQDLGSDTSSVWKISYFCTCSSDVILERNSNGIVKCWLFSRAFALVSYHIAKKWPIPPPKSRMIFPLREGWGMKWLWVTLINQCTNLSFNTDLDWILPKAVPLKVCGSDTFSDRNGILCKGWILGQPFHITFSWVSPP